MSCHCTVADVKREMAASAAAPPRVDYDATILTFISVVSRRIDGIFQSYRPMFEPTIETVRMRTDTGVSTTNNTLALDMPLLALTSVNLSGTALTINTDVELYPQSSRGPFRTLRLMRNTSSCVRSWYTAPTDGNLPYVDIEGVWGLHPDYTNAWANVDTLTASMTSSATTFTVNDTDGGNLYGITPRFSAGNLVKIDSEYMRVIAVDDATNTVTVIRAMNGSTAAAHDNGAVTATWQVPMDIKHVTAKQVGMTISRTYTTSVVEGMTEIRFPSDLLTMLRGTLSAYAYT